MERSGDMEPISDLISLPSICTRLPSMPVTTLQNSITSVSCRTSTSTERAAIGGEVQQLLKQNRYNPQTQTLIFTSPEVTVLSKSNRKVDGILFPTAIESGSVEQPYQGPKRTPAIDRFLRLDRLGFRGESSWKNIFLHK